jgi:hypothetical protein
VALWKKAAVAAMRSGPAAKLPPVISAAVVARISTPALESRMPTLAEAVGRCRLEPPRHPLDEQVEVAGETFHVKGIKKVFRESGMPITDAGSTLEDVQCILAPEPWNPHDSAAVAVMVGLHQVGYLPGELARQYARPLAALAGGGVLATGLARIWAKTDAGVVRARVTILIPEAHQF